MNTESQINENWHIMGNGKNLRISDYPAYVFLMFELLTSL